MGDGDGARAWGGPCSRWATAALIVTLVLLPLLAEPGASAAADPARPGAAPNGDPTVGPLVAGQAAYLDGTFVWTDYVYDDTGDGSVSYDADPGNLADLVQLQITPGTSAWRVRAVLQTLLDPSVPVLGVGFDLDGDPTTGTATVPGGAWQPAGGLGLERFVVIDASGTTVLTAANDGWEEVTTLPSDVDPETNVIEAEIPADLLVPTATTVGVVGVLGPRGSDGGSWRDGRGEIFDLAFVGDEPPVGWQSSRQEAILRGDAASDGAVARVDLELLERRATVLPDATHPGFHTRLYRSALDLGEGIRSFELRGPAGTPIPIGSIYAGPYQPYLVWIPSDLPPDPALVVMMHGFGGNHLSPAGMFATDEDEAGAYAAFRPGSGLFDFPAVVVSPLGRVEAGFYIGPGEQDVLDAVDDALAHYGADPDRVVLSGVSMGGFGTFRLATRYPDRWSVAIPLIGTGGSAQAAFAPLPPELLDLLFPAAEFPGGSAEMLANVRNLPWRMVNGTTDPIVNSALSGYDAVRLIELGYDVRAWSLVTRTHEVAPAVTNCVFEEAVAARRDVDPARVTFTVQPALHMVDESSGLRLVYDRAYWLSDVRARDDVRLTGEIATIDVVSLARADRSPATSPVGDAGVGFGADLCGPNPDVSSADAWVMIGNAWSDGPTLPVSNGIEIALDRITSAQIDLTRTGVNLEEPLEIEVAGDGPAELLLAGAWRGPVTVTRDGAPFATLDVIGGAVTLGDDFSAGAGYVLTSAPAPQPGAPPSDDAPRPAGTPPDHAAPPLPATGGPGAGGRAGAGLAVIAVIAALARRISAYGFGGWTQSTVRPSGDVQVQMPVSGS